MSGWEGGKVGRREGLTEGAQKHEAEGVQVVPETIEEGRHVVGLAWRAEKFLESRKMGFHGEKKRERE